MFFFSLIATYWVGGWKGEGQVDPFLMAAGVALALIHPLIIFVPILLYDVMRRRFGRISALIALPVLWVGYEYFHSLGDLSFPWLSLHNTQTYNIPFIQFIEFTGSYGLSLLIVIINVLFYLLLRFNTVFAEKLSKATSVTGLKKKARVYILASIGLLFLLPYLYGWYVLSKDSDGDSHPKLRVTVVQPNLNPWDKWSESPRSVTDSMFRSSHTALASAGGSTDLFLWPETAITYPITLPRMHDDLEDVYRFIESTNAPILTGIPDREEYEKGKDGIPQDVKMSGSGTPYRDWNSAMLFYKAPAGKFTYQRYHKEKLVPFGEHVPFVNIFPVLGDIFKWGVGLGSWNTGVERTVFTLPIAGRTVTQPDTARICTMICYESIYPDYVREFVARGAEVITIVTNDGWYGKSSGPYQHNRYAVLRAIENRRWIARSANTGISSIIDDKGRFIKETDLFKSACITESVPLKRELTFYTKAGDFIAIPFMWVMVISTLYFIVTGFIGKRKAKGA
jgi:apolipoprotein N-acyltransferase